jgi:hypothetical protein
LLDSKSHKKGATASQSSSAFAISVITAVDDVGQQPCGLFQIVGCTSFPLLKMTIQVTCQFL